MGLFHLKKNEVQNSKEEFENNFLLLAEPIIHLFSRNIKDGRLYNACSDFFNYSQDVRPNKLLDCKPKSLLPIGCAFAITAIEIDFGNPDISSISAENALYCLIRHYEDNPKTFGNIPYNAVVSMLLCNPDLLHDGIMHVLRFHPDYLIDLVEQLNFRSGENSVRYRILKYLIPYIFDLDKQDFKIEDLPLAPPKDLVIQCINSSFYKHADVDDGEDLLAQLYSYCELGVSQP